MTLDQLCEAITTITANSRSLTETVNRLNQITQEKP